MNAVIQGLRPWSLIAATALLVSSTAVIGQGPSLASDQMSGAQLQSWLDQKFAYAGLHHTSNCTFMNAWDPAGRALFLSCPNGWSAKIVGSARVDGDRLCTNFVIPNQPAGDECLTWHRIGDARFAQRAGGTTSASVVLLNVAPSTLK